MSIGRREYPTAIALAAGTGLCSYGDRTDAKMQPNVRIGAGRRHRPSIAGLLCIARNRRSKSHDGTLILEDIEINKNQSQRGEI